MNQEVLKERTKQFALAILRMASELPRSRESEVIHRQIVRSATSVGANYRSACRARSRADFISKLGLVEQEADETLYWLEIIAELGLMSQQTVDKLIKESRELTAIFTSACRTAKASIRNHQSEIRNWLPRPPG